MKMAHHSNMDLVYFARWVRCGLVCFIFIFFCNSSSLTLNISKCVRVRVYVWMLFVAENFLILYLFEVSE